MTFIDRQNEGESKVDDSSKEMLNDQDISVCYIWGKDNSITNIMVSIHSVLIICVFVLVRTNCSYLPL